ncbi:hypothetical protein UXP46_23995, partial [Enterobacter ludwigii]
IDIDFGTLNSSEAQGTAKEKELSVYCSGAASYKLSLAGQAGSDLPLDNGMKVNLSLDGNALGKTISSSGEGVTSFKLKATLNGTP